MASVFVERRVARSRCLARLLVSAAVTPLLYVAAARAETVISTAVTAPIATATAASGTPDDLTLTSTATVTTTVAGPAVSMNSNNSVTSSAAISIQNVSDAAGVQGAGGLTGSIQNAGTISLVEDYTPTDADGDGDVDGVFAQGANRYGLRVTGSAPFLGNVVNARGGQITIEGNDSAGVRVEPRLQGDLIQAGGVSVVGDRSVGVRADSVAGHVRILGSVAATGEGASAVVLGDVGGVVQLQNAIVATGFRYAARETDAVRAKYDADDLKLGGAAVRITGSVGGGVLLDRPPADLDANVADEDGDGVADASETSAVVLSRGSAPALAIGGGADSTIGLVGGGEDAFGLVNKGQIVADGLNDGVSAEALRIGGAGGRVLVGGGINSRGGVIQANAYGASATAVHLADGADAAEIRNTGGEILAKSTTSGADSATAVLIDAGASARTFRNIGRVEAEIVGAAGSAQAVVDRSGQLSLIDNGGRIEALVTPGDGVAVTGSAIALDLRANTSGVTVLQWGAIDGDDGADKVADPDADGDGVDDADEPHIQGDVLLGSGDDRVELRNGALDGFVAFGAGQDALVLSGGARFTGGLSDSDGRLTVEVGKGRLALNRTGAVTVSSLAVGSEGALAFAVDPETGAAARLDVSGAATIAAGATIELLPTALLVDPQSFELIRAGSLSATGLSSTVASAPFLYSATLRADATAGRLYADLRRRSAAELGFNRSESQAYDAVTAGVGANEAVQAALLAKTDKAGFLAVYDQLLPEHSGAALQSARAMADALALGAEDETLRGGEPGQAAFWAKEIYLNLEQDRADALGFKATGVGLAAGLEKTWESGGAYGLSLGVVSTKASEAGSPAGDRLVMNAASGSLYVRKSWRGLRADASATAGFIGFDNARRIVSETDDLDLTAKSDWLGWFAGARVALAYRATVGRLFLRPRVGLDYLRLHEQGYEEEGGGAGVDFEVGSRKSSQLTGSGSITFGLELGDAVRWGPHFTVGRRERLSGSAGLTAARFVGGAQDFSLDPENPPKSTTVMRGGFGATGSGAQFNLEGGLESGGGYKGWDVRATARFLF